MATNIDTGLTAAAALSQTGSPKIFTMSDGYEVAVYFNGTNWGYRIKAPGGSWGGRTALTSSPTGVGVFLQSGNTIMGVVGTTVTVYKLVYSTGTNTITQSNTANGDTGCQVLAAYIDGTNSRLVFLEGIPSAGVWLYSVAISNLGMFSEQMTANSPPTSFTSSTCDHWAFVGDGTSTCFAVWAESSTVKVNRISSGTTAAATTETAESNVNNLAAASGGLTAIFDNSYVIIVANENGGKIRRSRRSAQDTYDAWSDVLSATITGQPGVAKKGTGANADLAVLYRATGGQANGEIYKVQRIGGTWESSGALVAGGASTGWNYPNAAYSDVNQSTAGTVPIMYVTGTASTWTLVEDSISIAGAAGVVTGGYTSPGKMGGTKNVLIARASGIESGNSALGGAGGVPGVVKTGGFATPSSLGGTKNKAIAKSGLLLSSRYYIMQPIAQYPVYSRLTNFRSSQGGAFGGNNAEANAVDGHYGTTWNSVFSPAASGPQWYALDISTIIDSVKDNTDFIWKNGLGEYYDPSSTLGSQTTSPFTNLPQNYTIDAHSGAGGGAAPADSDAGWTNLVTVTNNRYNARIHRGLNLTGYNWIRIRVTASSGIAGVSDAVQLQFDLRNGDDNTDSIFFYGDSITHEAFGGTEPGNIQYPQGPPPLGPIENILEYRTGRYAPVVIDGGRGGWQADTGDTNKVDYIGSTPCKWVSIAFGTNDAHNAAIDLSTAGGTASTFATSFRNAYQSMIDYAVSLGKKVIIPEIPWREDTGSGVNEPGNVSILNTVLDQIRAANPTTVWQGPSFYNFFQANPNLLRDSPKIHPSYDDTISGGKVNGLTGYEHYLSLWANMVNGTLYGAYHDHMLGATGGFAIAKTGGPRSVGTLGGVRANLVARTGGIRSVLTLGGTGLLSGASKPGGIRSAVLTGASRSVSAAKTGGESSSASLGGTRATRAVQTGGIRSVLTLGAPSGVRFTRTGGISTTSTIGGSKIGGLTKTGGISSAGTLGASKIIRYNRVGGPVSPARLGATVSSVGIFARTGGIQSTGTLRGARFTLAQHGGFTSGARIGGIAFVARSLTGTGAPGMLISASMPKNSKLLGAKLYARN